MSDRVAGAAALAVAAVICWWAWRTFPHPREGGTLVLITVAALATAALFRRGPRRAFWPRATLFGMVVLAVQACLQAAAASGILA